jgi:hypothetical protein
VIAGAGSPGKRPWIAARTETLPPSISFSARESLNRILEPLGGRGGGSELLAQGSAPAGEDACREAVHRRGGLGRAQRMTEGIGAGEVSDQSMSTD